MAIERGKDRNGDYIICKGVVTHVYENPIAPEKIKSYPGKVPGQFFTPTHSINVIVDGDKIGLGLTEKVPFRRKGPDDKYHELTGCTVEIEIESESQYNGKPQYSSKASKVKILAVGAPVQQNSSQSSGATPTSSKQPYQKKDDTGMYVGHALKGASFLFDRFKGDIFEHGKFVHDITRKVQKEYQSRSGLNDYESGNASGNAVLLACQYAPSIDKVEAYAVRLLDVVVPKLTEYVRSGSQNAPVTASEQSSDAGSTSVPPNVETSSHDDVEPFDSDDDAPF